MNPVYTFIRSSHLRFGLHIGVFFPVPEFELPVLPSAALQLHNLVFRVMTSYTEPVGIAVNVFARIRKMLGSNLVRYTGYLD
jgi:hypothetical protein